MNTRKSQHTPTPPKVSMEILAEDLEKNGWTSNANDYIVRAVNSHEEMLKALRYLLLAHRNNTVIDRGGNLVPPNPDAIKQAEQAIAKAEGGQ